MKDVQHDKRFMHSIGEVAKISGNPVSTIHFYEAKGLIVSIRTNGNQRRYASSIFYYLAIIKYAQSIGISLQHIQDTLGREMVTDTLSSAQWRAAASNWHVHLAERIHRLQLLQDDLSTCKNCNCVSLDQCFADGLRGWRTAETVE